MQKTIAILTSGGDAPGMNAALRAVVRKALSAGLEVYGVERGYDGLIGGRFMEMHHHSVAGIISRGGTMLRTARSQAFQTPEGFAIAVRELKDRQIDVLVVIGGDGSLAGARRLADSGVATVVIPATIDNDMPATEYTLGFDSAVNTALDAVNKIRDTAASHEQVAVVEVMGRHSGHIALTAGLACGAEIILLPEKPADIEAACQSLKRSHHRGKQYSIVIVAEGVGKGHDIAQEITVKTGLRTHVTVLGYIQRGGGPTAHDSIMASRMGAAAVDAILAGPANCLMAWRQGGVVAVPYADIGEKPGVNLELYDLAMVLA